MVFKTFDYSKYGLKSTTPRLSLLADSKGLRKLSENLVCKCWTVSIDNVVVNMPGYRYSSTTIIAVMFSVSLTHVETEE